jgi:hypothetical protein
MRISSKPQLKQEEIKEEDSPRTKDYINYLDINPYDEKF